MNSQAFIDWALDGARTLEERFTLELLVEQGIHFWETQRKIYTPTNWEARHELERQRSLNPAYQPNISERDVRRTAECLHLFKSWWDCRVYYQRQVRDLTAFGFLTELEEFKIGNCEAADVSVLATLPKLRVVHFASADCEDLTPLSHCRQLRELTLTLGKSGVRVGSHWPKVHGLEKLQELESLSLTGNLLAFAPGISWPRVRTATLNCNPLAARSVRDLPQLPACEFLTLGGVEKLDGIEAFPRLRNLTISTNTHSFEPLTALPNLTAVTCTGFTPLDVRPLTRLPQLQALTFNANYHYIVNPPKPRDFSPLTEAALLRELVVTGCPPVEEEVKTLSALLLRWDDEMLAATPRPVPPLRLIIAKHHPMDRQNAPQLDPSDHGLPDVALRKFQGDWVGRYLFKFISQKIGCEDWGTAEGEGVYRSFTIEIHAYALVEKSREILEATREAIARLKHDYVGTFWIRLQSPTLEPTPAQIELQAQFDEEQEKADDERQQRERMEFLERQHRLELKKQLGEIIKPEDFSVPPPTPLPPAPWEREEEEDDEASGFGDIAVKEKAEPPPDSWDNGHPLADKYSLLARLTLEELWVWPHHRDLAVYLMRQSPDLEIPDEAKPE